MVECQRWNLVKGKPLRFRGIIAPFHLTQTNKSIVCDGDDSFTGGAVWVSEGLKLMDIGIFQPRFFE